MANDYKDLVANLKSLCQTVRILGSYPAGST